MDLVNKKLLLFIGISICFLNAKAQDSPVTYRTSLDAGWRFLKDSTVAAEAPGYNDSRWREVDLPHDWSIGDLPNQKADSIVGPFSKTSVGRAATGNVVGGTGWYRKKFVTGKLIADKTVTIYFDGIYMNADVWLNGHHLGNHPYGYSPFYIDLTPYLKPAGHENVLAVRVRNNGRNSRWYSGSGIYRHVWLTISDKVHVAPWGIYITTTGVSAIKASVHVNTVIENEEASQQSIIVENTIVSADGKAAGHVQNGFVLDAESNLTSDQSISVMNPLLWSVESPGLYRMITEIRKDGKLMDRIETSFGIRSISITAQNGFLLNGKKVLLKGGCIHHDNGPLGSATIDRAEERKIEILKQNGFNAIRTSHNPPSKQLLDACDRMGMLVIDEAFDMWERAKNAADYHLYFEKWWRKDLDAMVLRDRNHPSVIIWSIGNEINERVDSSGLRISKELGDEVRHLDHTRPVTAALCSFWDHPGYKWDTTANSFALFEVGGYNYQRKYYESDHQQFPGRVMMGTESFPREALENWNLVEEHPYVIGDFVWTAFDYIGESGLGNTRIDSTTRYGLSKGWPWFNAYCGDMDLIGNKKSASFYRDVVWRNKPLAMAVHSPIPEGMDEVMTPWAWPDERQSWTWPGEEGKPLQVRVFSRTPVVRLYLNNKLIGQQTIKDRSIIAVFDVPYQPGELKAVSIENGKQAGEVVFRTAGAPKHIRLVPDRSNIRADRNDLSFVSVEVTDDNGQVVPTVDTLIRFALSGPGEIAGVGNGNPTDMASFQQPERKTCWGKCIAIIRPYGKTGIITLKATADGLTPSEIKIEAR